MTFRPKNEDESYADYDEAKADHNEHIAALAQALVEKWSDGWLASALGRKFSCSEIQPLLDLFAAFDPDLVEMWTECHAEGDDDEDDEHHDLYLEMQ